MEGISGAGGRDGGLVGRSRELARLRDHLAAAARGAGRLVLVAGEAGIGKTALTGAIAREAAGQGILVLAGGCYDLTATPPYGPWRELANSDRARDRLPALRAALPDDAGDGPAGGRDALFAEVRDRFATAAERPIVVILEDLHWADSASLDLLRFLARQSAALPLLVIATYRSEELTRHHPVSPFIPLLVRESEADRIDLRPLDPDAVRELVRSGRPLPEADLDRLVAYVQRHSEGNPLLARELLRTLEAEGTLRPVDDGWALGELGRLVVPSLLRQIVEARLDRLGESSREPLATAVVIGEEVPVDLWQTVCGLDDDDLLAIIEGASDAGLLVAERDGSRVRFVHSLFREVLYEGVLPQRRRILHRRVGEALLAQRVHDADSVAYHLQRGGDPRAVDWLIRAGEQAQRAYAWLAAAERFAAAAALLAGHDERARDRGWLLYRSGRLLRFTDPAAGVVALEAAEELAGLAGDAVLAAYALADRGALRCLTGDPRRGLAELEAGVAAIDALPAAEAELDEVVASWVADALPARDAATATAATPGSPSGDARRGSLVIWLATLGRYADALKVGEPFLARVDALGTAGSLPLQFAAGDAGYGVGLTYAAFGRPAEAHRAFERAYAPAIATGHHFSVGWMTTRELALVTIPFEADRLAERRRQAQEAEAGLARAGVGVMPAGLSPRRAALPLLLLEGDWAEARRVATDACEQGTSHTRQEAAAWLARVAAGQGDTEVAWAQVRAVLTDGPWTEPGGSVVFVAMELQRLAVDLCLDADDLAGARAWLAACDRWLAATGSVRGRAETMLRWARLHLAGGDPALARREATDALVAAGAPRQPLVLLAAFRLLGEIETAAGRFGEAERLLDEALTLAEACAAPYERALTLLALAELRAASGQPGEARDLLDRVRVVGAELGARPLLDRADSLAARVAELGYPAGLSAREVEVLRLLAQGLSNPQIAAALSISRKTASNHVTSILTKLGVGTRAAAASYAARRGLV